MIKRLNCPLYLKSHPVCVPYANCDCDLVIKLAEFISIYAKNPANCGHNSPDSSSACEWGNFLVIFALLPTVRGLVAKPDVDYAEFLYFCKKFFLLYLSSAGEFIIRKYELAEGTQSQLLKSRTVHGLHSDSVRLSLQSSWVLGSWFSLAIFADYFCICDAFLWKCSLALGLIVLDADRAHILFIE